MITRFRKCYQRKTNERDSRERNKVYFTVRVHRTTPFAESTFFTRVICILNRRRTSSGASDACGELEIFAFSPRARARQSGAYGARRLIIHAFGFRSRQRHRNVYFCLPSSAKKLENVNYCADGRKSKNHGDTEFKRYGRTAFDRRA